MALQPDAISLRPPVGPASAVGRLRAIYIGALLAIACVNIARQVIITLMITDGSEVVPLINVAGRQRAMSQQVTIISLQLDRAVAEGDVDRVSSMSEALDGMLSQWSNTHRDLTERHSSRGSWEARSPAVSANLEAAGDDLQTTLDRARALLALARSTEFRERRREAEQLTAEIVAATERFFGHMNSTVNLYQQEAIARLQGLSDLGLNLGGVTLLVLVAVSLLVFEPALGRLARQHAQMQWVLANLARLSMIAEHTSDSVLITDSNRRIVWVNEAFTKVTGCSFEEALGQIPGQIPQCEYPDPDASARMQTAFQEAQGDIFELTERNRHGREFVLQVEIEPLRDEQGALTGFMAIEHDVTDVKRAVEALEISERKARAVFDQSFQFIGLLDLEGRVIDVNRAALEFANVAAGEVVGKAFWDTPWWSHSAAIRQQLREAIHKAASGELVRFETSHPDPTGLEHIVDFSLKPVLDNRGQVAWLMPEGRDITELHRSREQLRLRNLELELAHDALAANAAQLARRARELEVARLAAEQASVSKSEFLANMSHEIRTPMTAILGYAELLVGDETCSESPELQLEAARTIQRNGEHLLGLINDILDLSKIEAGKLTIEPISESPLKIVSDVVSLMRVRASGKGLALEVSYETPLPKQVDTDPMRLRQILVNLIGNAIKFTEVGSVRLELRLVAGAAPRLEFDIVDTGIGMTEAQCELLFRPFIQADASMTRRYGGTGLGLSISRRLAELLQGDVVVVESTPGVGTRFRLTLAIDSLEAVPLVVPINPTNVVTCAVSALPSLPKGNHLNGVRILLAEDGPDNQRLISFVLRKAGAVVEVVENGQLAVDTALQAVKNGTPFQLILMDMQMPVLDGYAATIWLRANGYTGTIMALTGNAMSGDRDKCLAAGCNDYATKPINRMELLAQIAAHIPAAESTQAAV